MFRLKLDQVKSCKRIFCLESKADGDNQSKERGQKPIEVLAVLLLLAMIV
jgi:hypothetical protein